MCGANSLRGLRLLRVGWCGSTAENTCSEEVLVTRGGLEGPGYAARRAELRRKAKEAARTRDRQAAAASQDEAEESDATEGGSDRRENDESGTTARWHEGCSESEER